MAKVTITKLTVANFGPYREQQTLDLQVTERRPVILVKALNGSGKTTLLTSLQVGLYGQRAIPNGRKSEYEALVRALLRSDADGPHFVEVGLSYESAESHHIYLVRREWVLRGGYLSETVSVFANGESLDLSSTWDEFIEGVLPAELIQLFFFDGEKIEALANPERLPDLLRRATEVFLGIGGIDSLGNDLKAVERRAALKNRSDSGEFEAARQQLVGLEEQVDVLANKIAVLRQERASARNEVDLRHAALDKYSRRAQRKGSDAYEAAASIKAAVVDSSAKLKDEMKRLAEMMSDPVLPTLWLGNLWEKYEKTWDAELRAKQAQLLAIEFKKRDSRLLKQLATRTSASTLHRIRIALAEDLTAHLGGQAQRLLGLQDAPPDDARQVAKQMQSDLQNQLTALARAQSAADKAEKAVGDIPAKEQIAGIFAELQEYAKAVADAELRQADIERRLAEAETHLEHQRSRLHAAQNRMGNDFRDKALEARSLDASVRARKALALFRERLLASKAEWLSNMITVAFQDLLRKKNLVAHVVVDPVTYHVSIKDGKGGELPMERLSAGERQLLAIAVLSALIKERKGRFPVVVDTPLARLDLQHRSLLIKRFFATVSHQVVVLSTDQEVEGSSYEAMRPHTMNEYALEYDDAERRTKVSRVIKAQIKEAA